LEKHELEVWLIDFAFRIFHIAKFLPKQEFDLTFVLSFVASLKKKYSSKFERSDPPTVKRFTSSFEIPCSIFDIRF